MSETATYCPFKGHAVTFSMGERQDIAWSYEQPIEGMEEIAGRSGVRIEMMQLNYSPTFFRILELKVKSFLFSLFFVIE